MVDALEAGGFTIQTVKHHGNMVVLEVRSPSGPTDIVVH